MDEITSTVNAGQENVVDSQNTEVQETQETASEVAQENSVQSEVAPTKPVQTPEENARFAQVRREAEQRARDATIAEMGLVNLLTGEPIKTYAEYQQALKDKEYQEQYGIDPNTIKPLFEELKKSDPDFQELSRLKQERILEQQDNALRNDPVKGNLYKQWEADVKAHASAIGCDLNTAFLLMLDSKLGDVLTVAKSKAEQEAIQKITTNGASSPGSLSEGGDGIKTFFTREEVKAMSKAEISKNYDNILKSMKDW